MLQDIDIIAYLPASSMLGVCNTGKRGVMANVLSLLKKGLFLSYSSCETTASLYFSTVVLLRPAIQPDICAPLPGPQPPKGPRN